MSTFFSQLPASGQQGQAPAPGQPSQGAPPSEAPPGGTSPVGGGIMQMLPLMLPLLLIFFMMRNQSKKQKQIEQGLKTGDTVVTQSGLIGKIIEMNERTVRLEIAPGVNVRLLKTAIQGIDPGDTKVEPKDAKDSKDAKPQEKKA
ncbi:MAG: preprotein translocase subunit YajC [Byssovorax sp.]